MQPLTKDDVEELAKMTCPHCRAGIVVRQRQDTKEYVHDSVAWEHGVRDGHSICWANGLRKELEKQ